MHLIFSYMHSIQNSQRNTMQKSMSILLLGGFYLTLTLYTLSFFKFSFSIQLFPFSIHFIFVLLLPKLYINVYVYTVLVNVDCCVVRVVMKMYIDKMLLTCTKIDVDIKNVKAITLNFFFKFLLFILSCRSCLTTSIENCNCFHLTDWYLHISISFRRKIFHFSFAVGTMFIHLTLL